MIIAQKDVVILLTRDRPFCNEFSTGTQEQLNNIEGLSSLASSRRSVSQGATQKTAHGKIKKARQEEARERLWTNLTKGRSGIPGSGIPSDWSILTDFANTRALLTQMKYTIWQRSQTTDLSTSNAVFKSVINNKLTDFPK